MRRLTTAGLAVCAATTGALAQAPSLVRQGELLARALCADCHALGRDRTNHARAPAFAAIGAAPSTTPLMLSVFLKSPHATMPDLILEEAQIEALAAYILDLGGKTAQ